MILDDDYGYDHTNIKTDGDYAYVQLEDKRIAHIERIRYLKGPNGILEFSYCIANLKDGSRVYVMIETQFSSVRTIKGDLLDEAKGKRVYAKGLGLLENISIY